MEFSIMRLLKGAAACAAALMLVSPATAGETPDQEVIDRGRYLVKIAACNDCHTPGYIQTAGDVPESEWLIGDRLGWRGPWGTTYASNLRLYMQQLTEDDWVTVAKTVQMRPPMPWFVLRDMTEEDLRAIHRFVTHLGPAGEAAPAYLPPGVKPEGPHVLFPSPPGE